MFPSKHLQSALIKTLLVGSLLVGGSAQAFTIDVYQDGSAITNMDQAIAMIDADNLIASSEAEVINLFDGLGGDGHFDEDQTTFPGGVLSDFVVHATGMITVETGGSYTFGAEHDDGVRVAIDGVQIINYPYLTDNRDTFGTIALSEGTHSVELTFFEHLGGASIEFFSQAGTHTSFNGGFELVRSSSNAVPLTPTLGLFGLGLLGLASRRISKRDSD